METVQYLSNYIEDWKPIKKDDENHVNVLILGGGLAGLGAAYSISKSLKNLEKFTYRILEAQNVAGGRIKTNELLQYSKRTVPRAEKIGESKEQSKKSIIDIGAQWLHGRNNLLYTVSENYQLLSAEQSEEGFGTYFHENCKQIDPFFVKQVDFHIGKLLTECEKFAHKDQKENCPKSVGHFLRERFQIYVDGLDNEEDKQNAWDLFDWHVRFQIIDNSCLSLDQLSAKYWGMYSFNGESYQAHYNFKRCFGSIIDCLTHEIQSNSIDYNKEVIEIRINNKRMQKINESKNYQKFANISVKCNDGSYYTANHVIVTFSLGVLKKVHKTLFKPLLPAPIRLAIESIGFETINKIFMEFDTIWWNDLNGIQLLFDHTKEKKHWTDFLTGFDILRPHSSNILLGWVGGIGAIQMEKLNDDQIIEDCVKLLVKFTNKSIPYPKRYYCTRWHSNPHVIGAYSYISTKCDNNETISNNILNKALTLDDFYATNELDVSNDDDLKINLKMLKKRPNSLNSPQKCTTPIVLFAGEACHKKYFSTAHGAFLNGIEQAQQIIDLYK